MADVVQWGIIGTGTMAGNFARSLADLPGASLAAVGSQDAGRARRFAQGLGIARYHGSYQALVNDPGIDIIYIASTNTSHCNHALLCLDAGKAVLCEKPFALNSAQAREVVSRARQRGLFCMEAMWTRFLPLITKLRELVRDNAIGEVQTLSCAMGYPFVYDAHGRQFDPALGGGALLDVGVYLVALAFDLFGAPDNIAGSCSMADTGVDNRCAVILDYKGGRLATLTASLTGLTSNDAMLSGSNGSIHVHEPVSRPDRLTVRSFGPIRPGVAGGGRLARIKNHPLVRSIGRRVGLLQAAVTGPRGLIVVPYSGSGYHYQAAEAMRCLRNGDLESPTMPLDQTIAILDVMDKLRASWGVHYPGE